MGYLLLTLLMLVSLFLMFVILLQRGRGGGLAGAFGGLGGQSAFGTKAGDVFTVITVVTVAIWVLLACLTGWRLRVEAETRRYGGRADIIDVDKDRDARSGDEQDDATKGKESGAAADEGEGPAKSAENPVKESTTGDTDESDTSKPGERGGAKGA